MYGLGKTISNVIIKLVVRYKFCVYGKSKDKSAGG